jgi:23S rRNA A2030 N6-methylase RlmJ
MARLVQYDYKYEQYIGGHCDVFKHIVLVTAVKELQKEHPEGVIVYDLHCGDGVYDLMNDCAKQGCTEYKNGILKLLTKYHESTENIPPAVRDYIELLYKSTGCTNVTDLDVYPGSPVYIQNILRPNIDEQYLYDYYLDTVQWINDVENKFKQLNVYDPKNFDTLIPTSAKHPIYFLDPPYDDSANDYANTKQLATKLLEANPYATVIVWIPFICNHRNRWSYPKGIRDMAKEKCKRGRYYCSMNIKMDGVQGSGILIGNPTATFDDVVSDTVVHFLANTMNQGKDEYLVEQVMKKKKSKSPTA